MTDFAIIMTTGAVILMALGIVAGSLLRGWGMWIGLRQNQLAAASAGMLDAPTSRFDAEETHYAGNRIELADLRERVRKLEAIAAGVDL